MSRGPFDGIDLDYLVDDTLPPNTLRLQSGATHIDFDVTWANGKMMLSPKGGEQ